MDFVSLDSKRGDTWQAIHGDCVDVVRQVPDNSIGFSVYSPPFSGLYIYNDSESDMGNCANDAEFALQYRFLVRELFRVTKPGRLVAVHCKDLVYYRTQTGHDAGLRDFPGLLVKEHTDAGFSFHSRVTIWRCPVREMTKTKARGLLYKQIRGDSTFSRQGLPEYLMVFRKWAREGEEVSPVTHTHESFPLDQWQEWASPVWMHTRETDVLNATRDPKDEKHICPMPIDLTTRAITLWSNPGDTVLSPFMGIGSEGFCAMKLKRKFLGVELKDSYFRQACRNIDAAEKSAESLFDYEAA
jgi:DNA modification methylase